MQQKQPSAISLFAGAGGCSLGFQQAGYHILYANELDKAAAETYKANFPGTCLEQRDICEIDFEHLADSLSLSAESLDILIGGPPCQGFSTAGMRFWDDPRSQLLKQYVRALKILRPKWFLMENVEGLLTTDNGRYLFEATQSFINLGYKIRLEKVYAHEYGVPQRRKRVIVLGNRLNIDFNFPKPAFHSHGRIFRKSTVTLRDALEGLPVPNLPEPTVSEHCTPVLDALQSTRIQHLQPGQTMRDLPEHLQHASFQRRANRRVMDGTPSEKRGGAPSGLKRLLWDEPCLTITGAAVREFVHPDEHRCLTIRECARIQTFPDDFKFMGSQSDKIQQIGNAIPPLLAKCFAEHIAQIGFVRHNGVRCEAGGLLGFSLSKSEGQSPVLRHTEHSLGQLMGIKNLQLQLF
jgi:DNA (cytosine-5)-methyltransferase 1